MSAEVVQLDIDEALEKIGEKTDEQVEERSVERCEECGGRVVSEGVERVCSKCGLVAQVDAIDHSGGVRTTNEPGERSPRTSPVDTSRHDGGLSTTFSADDVRSAQLKKWNDRVQIDDDRSLREGLGEVDRVADVVDATRPAKREARRVYKRARDASVLASDRCVDSVAAASVIIAARRHGPPRTNQDIVDAALVDKQRVHRALSDVQRVLDEPVLTVDPRAFLARVSRLECDDTQGLRRTALSVLDSSEDADLVGYGEQPQAACAAAVYAASKIMDASVTQEDVGDVYGVSTCAVRNHYMDYLDAYMND